MIRVTDRRRHGLDRPGKSCSNTGTNKVYCLSTTFEGKRRQWLTEAGFLFFLVRPLCLPDRWGVNMKRTLVRATENVHQTSKAILLFVLLTDRLTR